MLRYTAEWKELIQRLGRWVDWDHQYRTLDTDFMESVWWVFKTLWNKGLIYEGYKSLAYCLLRCAPPAEVSCTIDGAECGRWSFRSECVPGAERWNSGTVAG